MPNLLSCNLILLRYQATKLGNDEPIPNFILEGVASSVIKLISRFEEILSDIVSVIEDIRVAVLKQHNCGCNLDSQINQLSCAYFNTTC